MASGRIGRYVVKELVEAGHSVTSIDILAPEATSSRFLRVDLTDAGEVYQALAASGSGGGCSFRGVGECRCCPRYTDLWR